MGKNKKNIINSDRKKSPDHEIEKQPEIHTPTQENLSAEIPEKEIVVAPNSPVIPPKKRNMSFLLQRKFKGAVLMFIGVLMLIFIALFLINKLYRPPTLANLLPSATTLIMAEVNIDFNSSQLKSFFELFQKHPVYQKSGLLQLLNLAFPVNYENDLEPWVGRKLDIVVMENLDQKGQLNPLLFVENKNTEKALEFFKKQVAKDTTNDLTVKDYNNFPIWSYAVSQKYYFTFLDSYVVIAGSDQVLKNFIDQSNNNVSPLSNDPKYRKIADNLPPGGLAFAYANMDHFYNALMQNPTFARQKTRDFSAFQPLLTLFPAEGISLSVNEKQLQLQEFSSVNRELLNGSTYLTYSDKYEGKLLEYASPSPVLIAAGHNLYKELHRIQEIFEAGTKTSALLFNGLIEAQKQKYLGENISLNADVYPLLNQEYLLSIDQSLQEPKVSLLLELGDTNTDLARVEKIIQAFTSKSGLFEPKIQEVVLPDGTKGQEIVASTEVVLRTDEIYHGINISSLKLGNLSWGIHYAVLDNTLMLSTHLENLQSMIDRGLDVASGKKLEGQLLNQNFKSLISSADEVFHLKLDALTEISGLNKNVLLKPYLEPFMALTVAKNFFDDGISTIYTIDVF